MITLVDGEPALTLPVDDPAFGQGLAVYEAVRTYARQPFRLPEHLARLRAGAAWLGLPCPPDATLAADVARAAAAVPGEATILVTLTGGGRRVVQARPLDAARVGAPLTLASLVHEPAAALPAWVKSTNRAGWNAAARRAAVDEVLLVGADGAWLETHRGNLVAVRGGVLLTPPADGRILPGVTRAALLEAARAAGLPMAEAPLRPGPVAELYVASTLKELAPVVALDGQPLPGWGPLGRALAKAFAALRPAPSGSG